MKTGSCTTSGDDSAESPCLRAPSVRRQYSPSPASLRPRSLSCHPSAATADWTLRRERSMRDASTWSRHAGPRSVAHDTGSTLHSRASSSSSPSSSCAVSSSSSVPYAESVAVPGRLVELPPPGSRLAAVVLSLAPAAVSLPHSPGSASAMSSALGESWSATSSGSEPLTSSSCVARLRGRVPALLVVHDSRGRASGLR